MTITIRAIQLQINAIEENALKIRDMLDAAEQNPDGYTEQWAVALYAKTKSANLILCDAIENEND